MVEDIAVTSLRKYLRIKTEQPNPDYESCKRFLLQLGDELRLEKNVYECVPGKPIVVLTHRGTDPSLPSLLLNSHTDVVPALKEQWTHGPYEGFKTLDGKIYGRGAQDMKSVGIQYLEALRRLFWKGKTQFLRTIHITFVPDEEIGGKDGMEKFVETEEFEKLNIGFALDEGIASETEEYKVFCGERSPWWLVVTCKGRPGHGSIYQDDTASEKFRKVINLFMSFADNQKKLLKSSDELTIADVITVNLTKVEGGVEVNVLPTELKAYFDIRMPPTFDFQLMENEFKRLCEEAGPGVEMHYMLEKRQKCITSLSDDEPWWKVCTSVFKKMNMTISKQIFRGSTDARFIRAGYDHSSYHEFSFSAVSETSKGHKAIGISLMNNTPVLLHDHDEYIDQVVFLRGIEIYENLIESLANLPKDQ